MASKFGTRWQKSRFRSWGQKIRPSLDWVGKRIQHHPYIAMGLLVLLLACIAFALAVHWWGWDWTGFTGGYGKITIHTPAKDTELPPARTLWDWLQLLVIPLMLAIGGFWLNRL